MAGATLTTNLTAAQKTIYEDDFLMHFKEINVAEQFGQVVDVPHGAGKTVDFFRYHPLAKATTAGSEGAKGFTFKALTGMAITATLEEWYDQVDFSMLHWATSRDRHLTAGVELLSQQAGETAERNILKTLTDHCIWPLPANAITSAGKMVGSHYTEDVTFSSVTSTTSVAIKFRKTTAGAATGESSHLRANNTNGLKGGWLCVSKGKGYGHACRIITCTSDTGAITLSNALPETPQTNGNSYPTKCTIVNPFTASNALTAADKIGTEHLVKAGEILFKNGIQKFDDGFFACLVTPEVHTQLMFDKKWQRTAEQTPASTDGGYRQAEIARWGNFKFFRMTTKPRFATAAETVNVFSETAGRAYVTFCLGKNAFGVVGLGGGMGTPRLSFKIPQSDDGNTSNPNNTFGTMGWYRAWVVKELNANACVGIISMV